MKILLKDSNLKYGNILKYFNIWIIIIEIITKYFEGVIFL